MKIAFFSNFFNHHQLGVSDELWRITKGNFYFIETMPMPETMINNGYPQLSRVYIVRAYHSQEEKNFALSLALNADVAIFGGNKELELYRYNRLKQNKLSFEHSERWLKKGYINLFSPRLIYSQIMYHIFYRNKSNYYALCSGAYAHNDYYLLGNFRGKCFKWGYFTEVDEIDISKVIEERNNQTVKIMWCSRFIGWKHPELPIQLAQRLKKKGFSFHIDMYGSGAKLSIAKNMATKLNVNDVVSFKGNLPNQLILSEIKKHHLFLFTSDQNEGWGAVANEAQSNGCLLIGSDEIGAVPFLVENDFSGLIFKSRDIDSLVQKVEYAISNIDRTNEMIHNAYFSVKQIWSPQKAAENFVLLADALLKGGNKNIISEGICSEVFKIKR